MDVFVVRIGTYHKWGKSRIVYEAETYEAARAWLEANLKIGEHGYIDKVQKVRMQ